MPFGIGGPERPSIGCVDANGRGYSILTIFGASVAIILNFKVLGLV